MKPRKVIFAIEATSDLPLSTLRRALYVIVPRNENVTCEVPVEQCQVNVVDPIKQVPKKK